MIATIIKEPFYQGEICTPDGQKVLIKKSEGINVEDGMMSEERAVLELSPVYSGVYGLGEKFDSLNQKGKTVEVQVIEKFCNQGKYTYCTTPFFVTDTGIGVYVKTKEKTIFIFEDTIRCIVPREAEIYLFTGTIREIISDYTGLFGKIPLLPEYALGIWISANRWNCQKDVEKQLEKLKKNQYPASVLVLEAWSDEATFYIWNGAKYSPRKSKEGFEAADFDFSESPYWPNPQKMIEILHQEGIKLVLWQIPVFKEQGEKEERCCQLDYDKDYAVEHNLCVNRKNGEPYRIPKGNWFAGSYIPDFIDPDAREFWFNRRRYLLEMGVDGFKTDGGEFIYTEDVVFADGTTGKQGKNQYCQDYLNAYTEFIGKDRVLFSRAGYAGACCTPIHWAGDHESTNEELKNVLTAGLSAAMSGIAYWSFDIGGFAGELPSLDLYRRATQMACFCPVMQWHSEPDGGQFKELLPGVEGNNERSPWNMAQAYGQPEFLEEMRYWHNLRMELLPYIYQTAVEASQESVPMMRPIIYSFPKEREAVEITDEYMLGDNLLVAPLLEKDQRVRKVYLPEGRWYGFFSHKEYEGGRHYRSDSLEKMPVYVREGSIIPTRTEEKLQLTLYGASGSDRVYIDNSWVDVVWNRQGVTVKGVMAKAVEWLHIS